MNLEKLLDDFINAAREGERAGSGDDGAYEEGIIDYIHKQKNLWIQFAEFVIKREREYVSLKARLEKLHPAGYKHSAGYKEERK